MLVCRVAVVLDVCIGAHGDSLLRRLAVKEGKRIKALRQAISGSAVEDVGRSTEAARRNKTGTKQLRTRMLHRHEAFASFNAKAGRYMHVRTDNFCDTFFLRQVSHQMFDRIAIRTTAHMLPSGVS